MTEKILVGVDGSEDSQRALDWAVRHAAVGDHIEVIHTWRRPMAPSGLGSGAGSQIDPLIFADIADAVLDSELQRVQAPNEGNEDQGSPPLASISGRTECGHAGAILTQASKHADLLVVGTRGRGAVVGVLLGSTSTYLTHHASCPVVIVP